MKHRTCATCAYYHAVGESGECRAMPPVPIKDEYRDELHWFSPQVEATHWCGLYELGDDGKGGNHVADNGTDLHHMR